MSDILPNSIKDLADFFHTIPGIGKKTALRYTIQLFNQEPDFVKKFGEKLKTIHNVVGKCKVCNTLSETPICSICSSTHRDNEVLCIVEDVRDIIAIENTQQFKGKYHVLGGVISPIDGVGPQDLFIDNLITRLEHNSEIKEIVFALSTTMEGDTTNYYLYKKLQKFDIKFSMIARGVGFGGQLEYADEITLGKSIHNRMPYENL
jgi:recombination protein RecR